MIYIEYQAIQKRTIISYLDSRPKILVSTEKNGPSFGELSRIQQRYEQLPQKHVYGAAHA